ncbi:MAG: hypothetical protein Q8N23_16730 [Archangium sp.]|nr:hypothetical protein [Archangium sp.]MDP3154325.1 hypothetical protein [Archangium sp.]MDP3574170.1 hypothetical protein [Archangium sp.]
MTTPKSKTSKSKSKKTAATPAATSKKVSKTAAVVAKPAKLELQPEVIAALPPVALPEPILAPVRVVSRAEFMTLVRAEAYRRAHTRNFRNGSPFQDWVNAEAAVSGKLAAEGARVS